MLPDQKAMQHFNVLSQDEQAAAIRRLATDGQSVHAISSATGLSVEAVAALVLQAPISPAVAAFVVRLAEHGGVAVDPGSETASCLKERIRTGIVAAGLESVVAGRGPDRRAETFGTAFERCFGEPLQAKARGQRRERA